MAFPDAESGDDGHRILAGNYLYPYPGGGGLMLLRNRHGIFDAYVGSGQALSSGIPVPPVGFRLYGVSRQGLQLTLWMDGVPVAFLSASSPLTIEGTAPLIFAGRWDGTRLTHFQFWKGRIGPYFFFPRALNLAEMSFLNSCGQP